MTSQPDTQMKSLPLSAIDVLYRWRKFLFLNIVVVTSLAIIVSFLMPKWYRASASILPPKDQGLLNPFGAAGNLLKGIGGLGRLTGLGGSATQGPFNYLAILKSRAVNEAVVREFSLFEAYDIKDSVWHDVLKELSGNTSFEVQDDDYITIDVYDKSPQRAAEMANYYVKMLNEVSIRLGTQEAKNNREFIERRLAQCRSDLRASEDAWKTYQERSGILISPEQTSGQSAIAEIYALKARKEIELGILRRTIGSENPKLQQLELELKEVDRKVNEIPDAGVSTLRLYREVAIQQRILEFLVPLYEQAKVDEQKDVPVLLVLDKAEIPQKKAKPNRMLVVLITFLLVSTLSVFATFYFQSVSAQSRSGTEVDNMIASFIQRVQRIYHVS